MKTVDPCCAQRHLCCASTARASLRQSVLTQISQEEKTKYQSSAPFTLLDREKCCCSPASMSAAAAAVSLADGCALRRFPLKPMERSSRGSHADSHTDNHSLTSSPVSRFAFPGTALHLQISSTRAALLYGDRQASALLTTNERECKRETCASSSSGSSVEHEGLREKRSGNGGESNNSHGKRCVLPSVTVSLQQALSAINSVDSVPSAALKLVIIVSCDVASVMWTHSSAAVAVNNQAETW